MLRRRRGVGLLGAAAIGGVAYAAGNSAARGRAQEEAQNQQIADMQAQMNTQQYQAPPQQTYAPPPPAAAQAASPPATSMDDKLAQLQRLAELQAAGILTEAEVAVQKEKILSA